MASFRAGPGICKKILNRVQDDDKAAFPTLTNIPEINEFIKGLQQNHIDMIVVYHNYCRFCKTIRPEAHTQPHPEGFIGCYVIWFTKGNFYAKSFLKTQHTDVYPIAYSEVLDYLFLHQKELDTKLTYLKEHKFGPPFPEDDIFHKLTLRIGG